MRGTLFGQSSAVEGAGFEPAKAEPPDLQSGPFNRSGIPPKSFIIARISLFHTICHIFYFFFIFIAQNLKFNPQTGIIPSMRSEIINELGLSPLWKRRDADTDNSATAKTAAPAAVKDSPPTPPTPVSKPSLPPSDMPDETAIARMQWQPLHETVMKCHKCALAENRTQAVFGVGDTGANIFFVGEGPGFEEDKKGEPFVGAAGKLLDAMLKSIGMGRDSGIYIANIVKCRPPQNRNPKPEEAKACMVYLRRQLELASPRLIVALGGVASAHLLNTEEPVGKLRQRLHDYNGIPLVVTYHPAYLLRAPAEKRKSWDDLILIRRLAKGEPSE